MIEVYNYREITKKDKVKGLTRNAWVLILLFGVLSFIIFFVYGLVMTIILMIALAVLEFFDDDIYDIVQINFNNKFQLHYYA